MIRVRRQFLRLLGSGLFAAALVTIAIANDPVWIEKHRRVVFYRLQPGEAVETVIPFDAAPGDYASVVSSSDLRGLVTSTSIDNEGRVVITTFNPTSAPVSLSTTFSVRLHKM